MAETDPDDRHVIDRLYATILSRRGADPDSSHTARLFSRGSKKIAQKTGEEAVELIIEAIDGEHDKIISESADLMYHLLVLWANAGISVEEIWRELAKREGTSGIAEKAARKRAQEQD